MIIQNLHKKLTSKSANIKSSQNFVTAFVILICLLPTAMHSQDSIAVSQNIEDRKSIEFQELFFSAITNKAINNYQKAIENLEECNQLTPNDKAVLFELSKNYLKLGRFVEAVNYAEQALALDSKNLWIAEHLVSVYKSSASLDKAIALQKKIIQEHPKKKQNLALLYLQTNHVDSAKIVLKELENAKLLSPRFRQLQANLNNYKKPSATPIAAQTTTEKKPEGNLEELFKKEKSFSSLKELLQNLDNQSDTKLLLYSEEGLALFPAQPFVYLMNAKANNRNKNYKKALLSLENGIDFVIDDPAMETNFYREFIVSYKGVGDSKNVSKYQKKLKE